MSEDALLEEVRRIRGSVGSPSLDEITARLSALERQFSHDMAVRSSLKRLRVGTVQIGPFPAVAGPALALGDVLAGPRGWLARLFQKVGFRAALESPDFWYTVERLHVLIRFFATPETQIVPESRRAYRAAVKRHVHAAQEELRLLAAAWVDLSHERPPTGARNVLTDEHRRLVAAYAACSPGMKLDFLRRTAKAEGKRGIEVEKRARTLKRRIQRWSAQIVETRAL